MLVFESTVQGPSSIHVINRDGTGLRRVIADRFSNYQPNWSPDGKQIVFSSDRSGHGDIYVVNLDGTGVRRLTTFPSGAYYQSSFSPDGQWIAFQGRPDNALTADRVFVVHVEGHSLRQLSDSAYGAEGPRWSPDGRTIRFNQVPYPRRFWHEMEDGDLDTAKTRSRLVAVRLDGTGLAPLPAERAGESSVARTPDGSREFYIADEAGDRAVFERRGRDTSRRLTSTEVVPAGFEPSPSGSHLAYTKTVNGFAGVYVFDVAARHERLLTGGPGAGPLGYLRTAALTASVDTFDTYTSARTGGARDGGGSSFIRSLRRVGARKWEIIDAWMDSSGRVNTRQLVRTGDGTLATEIETVRADSDSASLLVSPVRVTAWVVPQGENAKLFDGPPAGERYAIAFVNAAIAMARQAVGATFLAPNVGLFTSNPLLPLIDTLRIVGRDTVQAGGYPVPVVVIERNAGTRWWVNEQTGVQVAARGSAGPQRWWWHIRRGVSLPD